MRKLVLLFCALSGLFLAGCIVNRVTVVNHITVFVHNDTEDVISDVRITWGTTYDWGEHLRRFNEIQPGQKVKFTIPTDIDRKREDVGTDVDMSYIWRGERNFFIFCDFCGKFIDFG